jgi:hypothetical protein
MSLWYRGLAVEVIVIIVVTAVSMTSIQMTFCFFRITNYKQTYVMVDLTNDLEILVINYD